MKKTGCPKGYTYLSLWHKTSKKRADKILKKGFKISFRGKGCAGGERDLQGISFGTSKYYLSDGYVASELNIRVTNVEKILANGCFRLLKTNDYPSCISREESVKKTNVIKKSYDAVLYPSGEVIVLKPKLLKNIRKQPIKEFNIASGWGLK